MDQHHHQQHDNDQQHRNHWNIDVNNEHSFNDIYYVGASEWTMRWETYWDLLHSLVEKGHSGWRLWAALAAQDSKDNLK